MAAMRSTGVLLLLSLLGCPSPAPPPAAPEAAPTPVEVTPVAEPPAPEPPAPEPPPPPPCDRLRAEHQAALERAGKGGRESLVDFFWCQSTPSGSQWAVVIDDLRPDPSGELDLVGHWSIVHLSADGSRASLRPAVPSLELSPVAAPEGEENYANGDMRTVVREDRHDGAGDDGSGEDAEPSDNDYLDVPSLHDFDGDGEPELFLRMETQRIEAAEYPQGRLWTFRDGRIAVYPPVRDLPIASLRDLDGDGRPDLSTYGPYRAEADDPVSDFTHLERGPRLWARSLPDGTFSFTDPVALAANLRACPRKPKAIHQPTDAACARLWGMSEKAVLRLISRRCRITRDRYGEEIDTSGSTEAARAFASAPPPFSLVAH